MSGRRPKDLADDLPLKYFEKLLKGKWEIYHPTAKTSWRAKRLIDGRTVDGSLIQTVVVKAQLADRRLI